MGKGKIKESNAAYSSTLGQDQNETPIQNGHYVVISIDLDTNLDFYLFYLPITCLSWRLINFEPIILATDPRYLPTLLDKIISEDNLQRSDYLSMLMIEADLLASALPNKGKILGERLSEEWQLTNPEAAVSVKTDKGRLYFLEHIRFISPQSHALGIEDIRKASINSIKE
jgi:hypothetical protein